MNLRGKNVIHLFAESFQFWNQICEFRIVVQVAPDEDHGVVDDRRHFRIRLKFKYIYIYINLELKFEKKPFYMNL